METVAVLGLSTSAGQKYLRGIRKLVGESLGADHVPFIDFVDFDQDEFKQSRKNGQFPYLVAEAISTTYANRLVLPHNALHLQVPEIEKISTNANGERIKFYHVGESINEYLMDLHLNRVGLVGTKTVMQNNFITEKINEKIECIVPEKESDQNTISDIINNELINGIHNEESKNKILEIISRFQKENDLETVLLACGQLSNFIRQEDTDVPVTSTTTAHIHNISKKIVLSKTRID